MYHIQLAPYLRLRRCAADNSHVYFQFLKNPTLQFYSFILNSPILTSMIIRALELDFIFQLFNFMHFRHGFGLSLVHIC